MNIIKELKNIPEISKVSKKRGKSVYEITYKPEEYSFSKTFIFEDDNLYEAETDIETDNNGRYSKYIIHYKKANNNPYNNVIDIIKLFKSNFYLNKGA
jgi:hypothetical protein